jgi:hypothetical protein
MFGIEDYARQSFADG